MTVSAKELSDLEEKALGSPWHGLSWVIQHGIPLLTNEVRELRAQVARLERERDEARAMLAEGWRSGRPMKPHTQWCSCAAGGPGSYDGPQRDCPAHGDDSGAGAAASGDDWNEASQPIVPKEDG